MVFEHIELVLKVEGCHRAELGLVNTITVLFVLAASHLFDPLEFLEFLIKVKCFILVEESILRLSFLLKDLLVEA